MPHSCTDGNFWSQTPTRALLHELDRNDAPAEDKHEIFASSRAHRVERAVFPLNENIALLQLTESFALVSFRFLAPKLCLEPLKINRDPEP